MNAKTNAIAMLTNDHREVEELFKQYEALGDKANAKTNNKKKELADQICGALTVHAMIEEEIFYPAMREAAKEAGDLLDEAVVEHASAKDLIMQIQEMDPEDELYDAKVKVLSELVEHHVKEEEKEMFPKAKKTELDLDALAEEMSGRREEIIATS